MNREQSRSGAAIILAGGKSSRMGRPKATLDFDGSPLIVHIVRKLELLFAQIIVVAAPGQEIPAMGIDLVRDEVPYQGPVGGIYYGMRASEHPICFVTSCDAPFLSVSLISHLLSQISDYDVVVPEWEERLQPLYAVYRSSVLSTLQEQLERNELRPIFLYDKVRTRKISAEEIRRVDPEGLSFLNMNTPADYEMALRRWQEIRQREEIGFRQRGETETAPPSAVSISVPVSVSNLCLTCTVELFGVARLLAKTSKVIVSLSHDATLADVFCALAEKLPVLAGKVIQADTRSLTGAYACNINGREFVRDGSTRVRPGDNVFILSADAGG